MISDFTQFIFSARSSFFYTVYAFSAPLNILPDSSAIFTAANSPESAHTTLSNIQESNRPPLPHSRLPAQAVYLTVPAV